MMLMAYFILGLLIFIGLSLLTTACDKI